MVLAEEIRRAVGKPLRVRDRGLFQIDEGGGSQAFNTNHHTVKGSCESGLNVEVVGPQVVQSVFTSCDRGRFEAPVEFTGDDGLKNVEARQVDLAGNQGLDDKDFWTDTNAPLVAITAPLALTVSTGALTLEGTCENDLPVILQGALQNTVSRVNCVDGLFLVPVEMSAGDGLKNIFLKYSTHRG